MQVYAGVIDGYLIPQSIIQTARLGLLNANAKQLLISSNTGDGVVGMVLLNNGAEYDYTAQEFQTSLTNEFGSSVGNQLYQMYNPSGYSNVQSAILALRTDFDIVCPIANILGAQEAANPTTSIYRDVFNAHILGGLEVPISDLVDLLTGLPLNSSSSSSSTGSLLDLISSPPWPAIHAFDVPYVFQNMGMVYSMLGLSKVGASDAAVQKTMLDYWTRFASDGSPQSPSQPIWPVYQSKTEALQILSAPVSTQTQYHAASCSIYNQVFGLAQ